MMDIQQPRTYTDEVLNSVSLSGLASESTDPVLVEWFAKVKAEIARRAEIRLERGEYGTFSADWYDSRPLADDSLPEHECGSFPDLFEGDCPACDLIAERAQ
jgi:hypothetical protein